MRPTTMLLALPLLAATSCSVTGPPPFPDRTTATLAGPLCDRPGRPCRCASSSAEAGEPSPGTRRFEVRLEPVMGTESAVEVEGIGSMVGDQSVPEPSCFYFDGRLGATYRVRYLVRAQDRDRAVSIAFAMREVADGSGFYDVLQQRCGSRLEPCRYEQIRDWTEAISGGHRFHDRCGTSRLTGMRVDGGTYDRHVVDGQLGFDLTLRHEGPLGPPGGACRDPVLPPGT